MRVSVVDLNSKEAPLIFVESLRETGFSILENHNIDMNLV